METIKLSQLTDFHGIDVSNEISLFEYGLLVKEHEEYLECFFQESNEGEFGVGSIGKKQVDNIINESWFNKNGFFSFVGLDESEWLNFGYAMKIHDLMQWTGRDNIFGSNCYTVQIIDK